MTSLYYEKCIVHNKIPTKSLIGLSQLLRAFNKNDTLKNASAYYDNLCELCNKLRYNRITLKEHPTFQFEGHTSTNWNFECIRVATSLKMRLLENVDDEQDVKKKGHLYFDAMRVSNKCQQLSKSIIFQMNSNRILKQMNSRFHLAETCSIAADRFHNMHVFRPNYLAILKAFQLKEMSTLIWDDEEKKKTLLRYKSKALLALAEKIDDDNCGEKVALLQVVANKQGCPDEVVSKYNVWKQQNEQVYYTSVYTDKKIETITLQEAFCILSKCFESHEI